MPLFLNIFVFCYCVFACVRSFMFVCFVDLLSRLTYDDYDVLFVNGQHCDVHSIKLCNIRICLHLRTKLPRSLIAGFQTRGRSAMWGIQKTLRMAVFLCFRVVYKYSKSFQEKKLWLCNLACNNNRTRSRRTVRYTGKEM